MKTGSVLLIALASALLGGLAGGVVSAFRQPEVQEPTLPATAEFDNLGAKSIRVGSLQFDEAFIRNDNDETLCMIKDGSIAVRDRLTVQELRTIQLLTGKVFLTSTPINTPLNECRIFGEMVITDQTGAVFILRNVDGVNIPAKGEIKDGNALFLGFETNGNPSIYRHDLEQGAAGRAYIMHPGMGARAFTPATGDPHGEGNTPTPEGPR